jgi:hypothetical protein
LIDSAASASVAGKGGNVVVVDVEVVDAGAVVVAGAPVVGCVIAAACVLVAGCALVAGTVVAVGCGAVVATVPAAPRSVPSVVAT